MKKEFTGFLHVTFSPPRDMTLYATKCVVYDVGVMFYYNDVLILTLEETIKDVCEEVRLSDRDSHAYIRGKYLSIYLKWEQTEPVKKVTENDRYVIRVDDESASRVFNGYYQNAALMDQEQVELSRMFEWELLECGDFVSKIKKEEEIRYVLTKNLTTIQKTKQDTLDFKVLKEQKTKQKGEEQ